MKFKSPHGPVDVPALGLSDVRVVEATGEHAESLKAQGWTRADPPRRRKRAAKKATPPAENTKTEESS